MNILITGGSGLIGSVLIEKLISRGHKVRILTRDQGLEHPYYFWDKKKVDEKAFKDLDGIIHLAGAPLLKRWTNSYKKEILDSRVNTANLLHKYVKDLKVNLKFFVSASGSSYYGQRTSATIFDEADQAGQDFLAQVCVDWEAAAENFLNLNTRVVCVRTPLVLAHNSDSFKLMKMPTKLGLGACLGTGKQWSAWVHINDLCQFYIDACEQDHLKGSYNVVATQHINHQGFMEILANKLGKKIFLPNISSALVKLVMGEKAELILEGARLSNNKLLNSGFKLQFETLDKAIDELINH